MPLYGIDVLKRSTALPQFANRYYTVQPSKLAAQVVAGSIVDAENIIFGGQVVTYRTHVWRVGVKGDFSNQTRADAGLVPVSAALAPFITADFEFGTAGSYPATKSFRVQVGSDELDGDKWGTSMLARLSDAAEAFNELLEQLYDRTGQPLETVSFSEFYNHRQLHKAWYNRSPAPPT